MLTLFSWGYWGWGSTTKQLIQAVDATEAARGYQPPVFMDIRIRRAVRAKGFSGGAFEKVVGEGRYIWESRLGNANVAAGVGGIRIQDPLATKDLLETAIRLGKERRRVIFFCSCSDLPHCHRNTVADLVLREAEKSGRTIEIVEWPGGTPARHAVEVSPAMFSAVVRGRKNVPLPKNSDLSEFGCLAWGSIVNLIAGEKNLSIVSGPAIYRNGWALPVLKHGGPGGNPTSLRESAMRLREKRGLEPRRS